MASDLVPSAPINIDSVTGLHLVSNIRKDLPPFNKNVDPRDKRFRTRRLLSRKKNLPTNGWRLSDVEFEKLNIFYRTIVEGCCDTSRLNRHGTLPYYSEHNYLLDNDVFGKSIYYNPPWSVTIACVQHLRACHAKATRRGTPYGRTDNTGIPRLYKIPAELSPALYIMS